MNGRSTGPGGEPVMQTAREGQPFDVSYPYSNGGGAAWRMTLDSVTCGEGSIFDPKILAADAASIGQPLVIPKPDPGMQFCLVRFTVTNKASSNQVWSADSNAATLNVGVNAYQDNSAQDPSGGAWTAEQAYPSTADSGLNPGVTGESYAVYQIPASAHATSVSVADSTALQAIDGAQPQVLITLGGAS